MKPPMKIEPVTLSGSHVRLVPLSPEHIPALWEAGRHEELWRWTWTQIRSRSDMERYVEEALQLAGTGKALPFATTDAATGRVIGSTRFGNAEPAHRRVEIGWTWISPEWQRTRVNTEAKLLMLRHAFESWGCQRVELKTDANNDKSRRAMLRIGASEEGVFRKHGLTDSGRIRDTAWYSITDDEWPAVHDRLEEMLARPWSPLPTP
jgi:N-acetyltransferase